MNDKNRTLIKFNEPDEFNDIIKKDAFGDIKIKELDMVSWTHEQLCKGLTSNINNVYTEALKRKGFEFEHRFEMEQFIKRNCRCEDYTHKQERIYFVNNIPFLLHKYNFHPELSYNEDRTHLTATAGEYRFL